MNKKKDNVDAGLLAAAALSIGAGTARAAHYPRKLCAFCKKPIVGGEGYRFLPKIGEVHGACINDIGPGKAGGKDADQGQAGPAQDRDGVCPAG